MTVGVSQVQKFDLINVWELNGDLIPPMTPEMQAFQVRKLFE